MSQFREVANVLFPDVSAPWLELVSSFTAWSFAADDELERCVDEHAASARAAAITAQADANGEDPLSAGLAQVLTRLSAFEWRRRHAASFVAHVHEFLDGCVWEASNRQRRTPPSLESYRYMRPYTGAIWPFLRVALAAGDVPLEAERHPLTQRILAKAAWLPCLANDLVSAEKEFASGDFHNTVILQMRESGASLTEAGRVVSAEYDLTRAAFDDELTARELPLDLGQRRLIANLVTGVERWQKSSARYAAVSE